MKNRLGPNFGADFVAGRILQSDRTITSIDELDETAKELASRITSGGVVALSGDLGAGKTTFTQLLAKHLGIAHPLASPTFALERQYQTANGLSFHHYDWYRLDSEEDIKQLGVEEVFTEPHSISVVEWPERAADLIPDKAIWMVIDYVDESTRHIFEYSRS